jgi:DNA mismatch repair protein MutS2
LQDIKYNLPEIVKAPLGEGNDAHSGGHWSGNNENGSSGGSAGGGSGFAIKTSEEFAKRFPAGTKIFVPRLNQDGIVQSSPNSKGEVQILSGSLRISLHWQDLKPAQKSTNMTSEILRRSSSVSPQFVVVDADRSLDLRGKTTEEAIEILEVELDQAAIRKEDRIKIIHGHGTEALKKAVRAYLSRSLYVKKWKAGASDQGGDGITWVELSSGD